MQSTNIDFNIGFKEGITFIEVDSDKIDVSSFSKKLAEWLSEEANLKVINTYLEESVRKEHVVRITIEYLNYQKSNLRKIGLAVFIDGKKHASKELPVSFCSEDRWFEEIEELVASAYSTHTKIFDYVEQPPPPYSLYSWPEDITLISNVLE